MGRKSIDRYRYKDPEVRQKHVVSAMIYFQENGVSNFSMSRMAADLNISKTTIYNHFESKEELIEAAVDYKLDLIADYETVLFNLTLTYTERYRKAMLFFCVQTFDISSKLLIQLQQGYPEVFEKVMQFRKDVFENLLSFYEVGVEIGKFKANSHPYLLAKDDMQFFEFLSNREELISKNIEVLEAFKCHYRTKFFGISVD